MVRRFLCGQCRESFGTYLITFVGMGLLEPVELPRGMSRHDGPGPHPHPPGPYFAAEAPGEQQHRLPEGHSRPAAKFQWRCPGCGAKPRILSDRLAALIGTDPDVVLPLN
jgi:hypothetical protein